MADFNQMMQDFVNKDYAELVELGRTAFVKVFPVCKELDKENDGFVLMTSILLSAVGADGKLSALENQWIKDVLTLNDEQIDNMIKLYNPKMVDLVDSLFDGINSTDFKADLMILVLSILSVDEHITKEETAFVKKLFA